MHTFLLIIKFVGTKQLGANWGKLNGIKKIPQNNNFFEF